MHVQNGFQALLHRGSIVCLSWLCTQKDPDGRCSKHVAKITRFREHVKRQEDLFMPLDGVLSLVNKSAFRSLFLTDITSAPSPGIMF